MSNKSWYDTAQEGLAVGTSALNRMEESQRQREAGDISMFESVLRQSGDVASIPSWMFNEVLSTVPGYEYAQEKLGQGVNYLIDNSYMGQAASSAMEKNPRLARNMEAVGQVAEFVPGVGGRVKTNKANVDLDRLTGVDSGKGMSLASLNNYIDDFYGRKEVTGTTSMDKMAGASPPITLFESIIEKQLYDADSATNKAIDTATKLKVPLVEKVAKKAAIPTLKTDDFTSTSKTKAAIRKITSMAKFGGTGLKNTIKDLFDPSSRALFREQGLSNTGKEIIASHLAAKKLKESPEGLKILEDITALKKKYRNLPKEKGKLTEEHIKVNAEIQKAASKLTSREIPKAVGEAIYQLHIGQQSGRQGGLNSGLEGIARESFVESYNKYDTGSLSSWFVQHNKAESTDFDVSVSKKDADILEETVINANRVSFGESGVPALVVMKEAANVRSSGNHQFDLFNMDKDGPARKINKAFNSLGNKTTTLPQLAKALEDTGLKITNVSDDGKVFFNGSTTGSAIVEGGINVSGFVKPDGTATFIMADVHDFFEKVPGVKELTPNTLLAVSPPVSKNFLTAKKITNKKRVENKPPRDVEADLETIANAKPSPAVLDAARRQQSGMLNTATQPLATALGNTNSEQRMLTQAPNSDEYLAAFRNGGR